MLADMQPPDLETLEAILRQKADELSIPMDSELSQYITTRIRGSIREMEGVLNRLKALCRLHNTRPDVEFARRHLGHMLAEASVMPSAQEIIETVATYYNVSVADLLGTRRHKQLVRPRHVAMWLVRKHTDQSFPDMGRTFGRDHATVQHAVKKMAEESSSDPDVKVAIQTILRNLGV
jgi:chromosomal replication initiator protein